MNNIRYVVQSLLTIWHISKTWVLLSAIIMIVQGLYPICFLWVSKEFINAMSAFLTDSADTAMVINFLLLQIALYVLNSSINHLQEFLNNKTRIKVEYELQKKLMSVTSSIELTHFDNHQLHNHIERIGSGGIGSKFMVPIQSIMGIVKETVTVCSLVVFLYHVHWVLIVISFVSAIPVIYIRSKFSNQRFMQIHFQTPAARELGYIGHLMRDRHALKEIKLFNLSGYLMNRWGQKYTNNNKEYLSLTKKSHVADIVLDMILAGFNFISTLIVIGMIRRATMQIGDFVAISQAIQGAQTSIYQISTNLAKLYEGFLYIWDYITFTEDTKLYAASENRREFDFPAKLQRGIEIDNLSFQYFGKSNKVLDGIRLSIKPGEKIAIVGENGSGKTTLVKCLMGLYEATNGCILIDGIDINQIDRTKLHENISVVFQDFMKFNFTLRENIGFGSIHQIENDEKFLKVVKLSGVDQIAAGLEDGYDTNLGRVLAKGEDLSGGQWQRIAFARSLFSDAQVIILDEPTAALDPHSERDLFNKFNELLIGKTALFISHRMAAAKLADQVIVMKNGKIVEVGTHLQLMERRGEYFAMYNAQAKWYETSEGAEEKWLNSTYS